MTTKEMIYAMALSSATTTILILYATLCYYPNMLHCAAAVLHCVLCGVYYATLYCIIVLCYAGWKIQEDPVEKSWHPEYEKPLGKPKADGIKGANGVWSRTFLGLKGETTVTFDATTNVGKIAWAGDDDHDDNQ